MHVLITKRLTLRAPLDVDTDPITSHFQDEAVTRNLSGVPVPYTVEDAQDWVMECHGDARKCDAHAAAPLHFTIHRNTLIGAISIRPMQRGDAMAQDDLGYWLARDHWGLGLMSEAARAVVSYAFRSPERQAIQSGAFVDNPASLRVLEKLGFEQTGERLPRPCPTRGAQVETLRCVLTRAAFEKRFGPAETKQAA